MQTDRATHEAWARLTATQPRAAQMMHLLCAYIGEHNAIVVSQGTLGKLLGCTERTIRNALIPLVEGNWLEVKRIGVRGTVNAYVINDRVAWTKDRDQLHLSLFSAQVIVDADEQPYVDFGQQPPLRRLPMVVPPEQALPVGPGEPGAQIALPGLEPVIERPIQSDQPTAPPPPRRRRVRSPV